MEQYLYHHVVRLSGRGEFPALLQNMNTPNVVALANAYVAAYAMETVAIDAHDAFEYRTRNLYLHEETYRNLKIDCTRTRQMRKRAWRELVDLLEVHWDYTSTDDEDQDQSEEEEEDE